MKFKIGDKVKCINFEYYPSLKHEVVGTVVGDTVTFVPVEWEDREGHYPMLEKEIELCISQINEEKLRKLLK